jgi:hypothetical protein
MAHELGEPLPSLLKHPLSDSSKNPNRKCLQSKRICMSSPVERIREDSSYFLPLAETDQDVVDLGPS